MPGFVRAVAIAERSVLGEAPSPHHPGVVLVDEARREGLRVILLSERSFRELRDGGDTLLPHFDGVVAESGAAVRVGAGPVRRVPASPRTALLEVLEELDVDPHDALGVSGDVADRELLDTLEVTVRTGDRAQDGADYGLPESGAVALRQVLDDARAGRPSVSPPRHDVTVGTPGHGRHAGVHVPGAHANILVCAAPTTGPDGPATGGPAVRAAGRVDVPVQLVTQWAAAGYSSVVIDLERRHPEGLTIDPTAAGWLADFRLAIRSRRSPVVLTLATTTGVDRSQVLASALAAVRAQRARSGRPHWLVIDPAGPVLADPDLPPEALDLTTSGHCLVLRDHRALPPTSVAGLDLVLGCGPDCPLPAYRR